MLLFFLCDKRENLKTRDFLSKRENFQLSEKIKVKNTENSRKIQKYIDK